MASASKPARVSACPRRGRAGILVHDPGAGGAPPQHVPDQAGDRGAIARAGKTMRGAPLLSAFAAGMRWMSMVSISSMAAESRAAGVIQAFGSRSARSDQKKNPEREIDHMANSTNTPANHASERRFRSLEVTISRHAPGAPPRTPMTATRSRSRHGQRQRDRDQDVEQDRQLELVLEAVADLGGTDGPVRLSEHDILTLVSR